jgi:hypothetical protein
VLHNLIDCAMAVECGIFEALTQLTVSEALPDHGRLSGWQMPIRCAGRHVLSGKVMILVAGAAFQAGNTLAFKSAADVHGVLVAIVSLAREVSGGVAVHAARMMEYWHDCLKRRSGYGIIGR